MPLPNDRGQLLSRQRRTAPISGSDRALHPWLYIGFKTLYTGVLGAGIAWVGALAGGLTLSDQQRDFFLGVLDDRFHDLVARYRRLCPEGSYGPMCSNWKEIALNRALNGSPLDLVMIGN